MTPLEQVQDQQRETAKQGGTNMDGKSDVKCGDEGPAPARGPEENSSGNG